LYRWNEEKNSILKATRKFSFDDVIKENNMQYDKEELELLEFIKNGDLEKIPFNNQEIKLRARDTKEYLEKKNQIIIDMRQSDLDFIKQRANDIGISYQNIIQLLIHNYTVGKVQLSL